MDQNAVLVKAIEEETYISSKRTVQKVIGPVESIRQRDCHFSHLEAQIIDLEKMTGISIELGPFWERFRDLPESGSLQSAAC
jgi:hypothetical protein